MYFKHRYDRNREALTAGECARLDAARACIIGCGGLGGAVLESLARIGVGRLRIVDGDVFEESNLNRQILCVEKALGRSKALVAKERVASINSDIQAEARTLHVTAENLAEIIAGMDCVVDCLDNREARQLVAWTCRDQGIPLVSGSIAGWFGQVFTLYPDDPAPSFLREGAADEGICERLGNLPFTAYAIAAIQSAETVKVLIGRDGQIRNRLLMLNLLEGSVETIGLCPAEKGE